MIRYPSEVKEHIPKGVVQKTNPRAEESLGMNARKCMIRRQHCWKGREHAKEDEMS